MNKYKTSLRKRPQYGQMINEVEIDQPKIKLPDRRATFLRNTHYLSQFDGDQSFINLFPSRCAPVDILPNLLWFTLHKVLCG